MAVTSANLVQDALEVIYGALAAVKTDGPAKAGVQALNEVATALNRLPGYAITDIAQTDAADAGVSEFIDTGGEGVALDVLSVFRTTNAVFDLTDNALATAKGSAVAAGDIYVVDGADSVEYLGNSSAGSAFDMSGETSSDFG